jgi:nitroimidazol reductase NimA-like FMN-containing flavoprotein (pyridoxamine 5'-phosphate oxidase superfamily)
MTADIGANLTPSELDAYLERGLTARLACLDERGWPYVVPVWHQWDGERFWVIASERAKWVRYLQEAPRVALTIDEPETVTRVLCQGTARYVEGPSLDGAWVAIALKMAVRYLGEEAIPEYVKNTAGMRRWLFAIDVERLVSWQGAGTTN